MHRLPRMGIMLSFFLFLFSTDGDAASSLPRYGIYNYSSLCYSKATGDTGGFRIVLLRLPEGDSIFFEQAPGAVQVPIVGDAKIEAADSQISFALTSGNESDDPIVFRGMFSDRFLEGTLLWRNGAGGSVMLRLPLRRNAGETCSDEAP